MDLDIPVFGKPRLLVLRTFDENPRGMPHPSAIILCLVNKHPSSLCFSSLHRQILSVVTHVHIHLLPTSAAIAELVFPLDRSCADCDPVTVFITMPHPLLPRSWLPSQCLRTIFHVSVCLTVSILMFETAICSQVRHVVGLLIVLSVRRAARGRQLLAVATPLQFGTMNVLSFDFQDSCR